MKEMNGERAVAALLQAVVISGGRLTAAAWQDNAFSLAVTGCRPESVASCHPCAVSFPGSTSSFEMTVRVPVCPPLAAKDAACAAEVLCAVHSALASCGAVTLREQTDGGALAVQWCVGHDALGIALARCAEQTGRRGWCETAFTVRGGANGCDVSLTLAAGIRQDEAPSPLWTLAHYATLFAPGEALPLVRPRHTTAERPLPVRARIAAVRRMDGTRFVYYRQGNGRIVCETESVRG